MGIDYLLNTLLEPKVVECAKRRGFGKSSFGCGTTGNEEINAGQKVLKLHNSFLH